MPSDLDPSLEEVPKLPPPAHALSLLSHSEMWLEEVWPEDPVHARGSAGPGRLIPVSHKMTTPGVIHGEQRRLGTASGSDQKFREAYPEVVTVVGHTSQWVNWARAEFAQEYQASTRSTRSLLAHGTWGEKRGEEAGDLAQGLIWRTWCLHPAGWVFMMRLEVYQLVVKI